MKKFRLPSVNSSDSKERELARWLSNQRSKYNKGTLSAKQRKALELIPGLNLSNNVAEQ